MAQYRRCVCIKCFFAELGRNLASRTCSARMVLGPAEARRRMLQASRAPLRNAYGVISILLFVGTAAAALGMASFRPCIDLHQGRVKQIVGSTLKDADQGSRHAASRFNLAELK